MSNIKIDSRFINDPNGIELSTLDELIMDIQAQYGGKKIKILSCVIRNDGTGWKQIGGQHDSVNVLSITQNNSSIIVNYDFIASNVLYFDCGTDETMALDKFFMGGSVGIDSTIIQLSQNKNIGGLISYNGTSWTILGDAAGVSMVWNVNKLVITHPSITGVKAQVSARDGGHIPNVVSVGATTTEVSFRDYAGTLITTPDVNMKVFWERTSQDGVIDPTTYANANGNIWIYGLFEVA